MRLRLLLLVFVAGGASLGAVMLAQGWLENRRAELVAIETSQPIEVETIDTIEVLVAPEDMPSGTFLKEDLFEWKAFPADNLPETYFTRVELTVQEGEEEAEQTLEGAVLRGALTEGQPLTEGQVIRPGERGFLAAVLRPEMRAISVPIDATTGIAGFVFPGDRVDLMLTHEIDFGGRQKRLATETILNDIRVLAVDQRTDDTEGEPTLAKTATLEVETKQAEKIAVALRMGRLSLALRALARPTDALAAATPPLPEAQSPSNDGETSVSGEGAATGQATQTLAGADLLQTYTWDSQASVLLPPAGGRSSSSNRTAPPPAPTVRVTVFRQGAAETLEFKE